MPVEKNPISKKLTPREYLGEGFYHTFRNDTTQELVLVETTKEQYESMGVVGGAANNPTLEGHTWLYSDGGTTRVDTESGFLGDGEYTIKEGKVVARLGGVEHNLATNAVDAIKEDGTLEVSVSIK